MLDEKRNDNIGSEAENQNTEGILAHSAETITQNNFEATASAENPEGSAYGVLTEVRSGETVDHVFAADEPVAPKKAKPRKQMPKKVMTAFLCILLACALFAGVWVLFSDYWLKMKDVTVAGIKMEGMTKKEAKDALEEAVAGIYAKQNMAVTVLDTTLEIPGKDAGIAIDVDKAINKAYHKNGKFNIASYITTGKGVDKVVDQLMKQYNTKLEQTAYNLEGSVPDLKTAEEAEGQTLSMTIGKPEIVLKESDLRKAILSGYGSVDFAVEAKPAVTEPEKLSANELYDKFLTAPVDAVLDKTKWTVTPETYGYSVNVEKAEEALNGIQYGDTVSIPFSKVTPKTTEASIWAELFKDVLGECSTPYSGSDNNNRNTNLRLACEKLDGMIILPGQTFSYNEALGPRTAAGGWKAAAAYSNGETVNTYGGGICQGSTTLYNCVLLADLKVEESRCHSYVSSYIGRGLDAAVSWGSPDFRFTNTANSPVKIEAYRKNGKMTMRLYGVDDKDYYIKMTNEVVSTWGYSVEYVTVSADNNPNGYRNGQVLTTPYSGCKARSYKNKYSKATNELIETKLERESTYKSRNKRVVRVISSAPAAPAE